MVQLKESSWFDITRYILSASLLTFSCVVTGYAILTQKTGFWNAVPGWAALILFILVLFLLGLVEGLQLALVELKRQKPDTYRDTNKSAYKLGQIAMKGDNIEKFLVGRQVIVVFLVFFAAKLTSITVPDQEFLFPVPTWVSQVFLETGLLASIVVVIVAQLTPQIVSSVFPVQFLDIAIMRPVYYACIMLEFTGIAHFCWVLVHLLSLCFGMNSKKEGWSAHDGYTAVAAPAVNICMADDLNGDEDDIHGETKKGGKFGIIEGNGNICRNHNNMGSNMNCMKYQDDKNHNACC